MTSVAYADNKYFLGVTSVAYAGNKYFLGVTSVAYTDNKYFLEVTSVGYADNKYFLGVSQRRLHQRRNIFSEFISVAYARKEIIYRSSPA